MEELRFIQYKTIQYILTEQYLKRNQLNILQMYQMLGPEHWTDKYHVFTAREMWSNLSDETFEARLEKMEFVLNDPLFLTKKIEHISEEAIFSMTFTKRNLLVYHHYNYLKEPFHLHTFFEIYYVFRGNCRIHFKETTVNLVPGDFLIIAPNAMHFVESDADNFVLCISIRQSNFDDLFFQQMSRDNILAAFFRNIIYNRAIYSYLLFQTDQNQDIKTLIKNLTMESLYSDSNNITASTSWVDILFSTLLRYFHMTIQTYPPLSTSNFSYIMQYIAGNYRTVTLDELCQIFSYSKPHLCNLIKENTGKTFTQLVNLQKVNQAAAMLLNSDYSVEEISEYVGFTSPDYFTKLFKKTIGQTPGRYRTCPGNSITLGTNSASQS